MGLRTEVGRGSPIRGPWKPPGGSCVGKAFQRVLCTPTCTCMREHPETPPLWEPDDRGNPYPAPPPLPGADRGHGNGWRDWKPETAEGSPNTPKYWRSDKGQKSPTQFELDGRGRAPTFTESPRGWGRGAGAKRLPPWLGSGGVCVNGDTVAEAPTLGTTLRKGRRAQAQIGNRWGHRARPETPDP